MPTGFQGSAFQNDAFQFGDYILVTPGTLALSITTYAPTIDISGNKVVTPPTLALLLTAYAPAVLRPVVAIPSTLALIITFYAPNVYISRGRKLKIIVSTGQLRKVKTITSGG